MTDKTKGQSLTGEYRVDVGNFGPISQASVELRPFTVFIGPSNTGKSYLSVLLYVLYQCLEDEDRTGFSYRNLHRLNRRQAFLFRQLADINKLSPAGKEEFRDWFKKLKGSFFPSLEVKEGIDSPISFDPLPAQVASYIRELVEQPQGFKETLERQIGRCFGVDHLHELIRKSESSDEARVRLSVPKKDSTETACYELKLRSKDTQFSGVIGESIPISYRGMSLEAWPYYGDADFDNDTNLRSALASMAASAFTSLIRPFSRNAYYLPADRTGVMHSHQVVVSTLIQSAATAGIRPFGNTPILSGVLADFLNELIKMRSRSRNRKVKAVATSLEENVLRGVVQVERTQTGYPNFTYSPDGWKEDLELIRASSMVSELAPVVLYLRHLVNPGDILIIEEPESHLHPAMQVLFTRELAAVVHAGVRVIVTTHSEWLLEELAKLVQSSQIPDKERQGIIGGDVALRADQVGAWLFNHDRKRGGSVVKEIKIDESGLYPSGFDDVAMALHNEWAEVDSRIKDDLWSG